MQIYNPTKEMPETEALIWRFREMGWPGFFRRFTEKDLLVVDSDILETYRANYQPLACKTCSPNTVAQHLKKPFLKELRRIFVFTRYAEQALVRQIDSLTPARIRTISMTYDVGPISAERPVRVPSKNKRVPKGTGNQGTGNKGTGNQDAGNQDTPVPPTLILCTPGSDASYLAQVMECAALGSPKEYIGRFWGQWVQQAKPFQLQRFLSQLQKHTHSEQGGLQVILYLDVLLALMHSTPLTLEHLVKMIERSGTRVIYLNRRDKLFQTGLVAALSRTAFRSVWDVPATAKKQFAGAKMGFDRSYAITQDLLRAEASLETMLSDIPHVKMITTEELAASPAEVAVALGHYLEQPVAKKINFPSYAAPYKKLPALLNRSFEFRRELIDRLGLHVNEHGSWTTDSDRIFDD